MAQSPWDITKWLYFVEQDNISVEDSFKEGNKGMATGKLAGHMPGASGSIDMELGNSIRLLLWKIEEANQPDPNQLEIQFPEEV